MVSFRSKLAFFVSAALFAAPAFASHVRRAPTAGVTHHTRHLAVRHRRVSHRIHGQQAIEPDRVMQIQSALIKAHYLDGDPSGKWDPTTMAAMQKYQADNGWQTKLMPDSRALEKLGLGPDYSTAINAKSAQVTPPPPVSALPSEQAAGFAAASGAEQ